MFKRLLLILLFPLTCFATNYPRGMEYALSQLNRYPEANAFLKSVEREGPITFRWQAFGQNAARALWYGGTREIYLNASYSWTEGAKISSLLFEMHNAKIQGELSRLDQLAITGQISKADYVRSVEKIEYDNTLKTAAMTMRGIRAGYLPYDAYLPVYNNFKDHFARQIEGGHSAFIACCFDALTSF